MNNFYLYLFLLLILSACGNSNKELTTQKENTKIIFEKSEPIKNELNSNLKINLSKLTKGEAFLQNNINNSGNINFETNFDKITSYKFPTIKEFIFNQPEILFTNDDSLVFFYDASLAWILVSEVSFKFSKCISEFFLSNIDRRFPTSFCISFL